MQLKLIITRIIVNCAHVCVERSDVEHLFTVIANNYSKCYLTKPSTGSLSSRINCMRVCRSQLNMIADTRKTPSSRGSLFTNFEDVQVSFVTIPTYVPSRKHQ